MKYVKLYESWVKNRVNEAEDVAIIDPSKFASMLNDAVKRAESIGSDKGKRTKDGEKVELKFERTSDEITMGVIEKFYPANIKDLGSNSQVYSEVKSLVGDALRLAYDKASNPDAKQIQGFSFSERESNKNKKLSEVTKMYDDKSVLYSNLYKNIPKESMPKNITDLLGNMQTKPQTAPEVTKEKKN